MMRLYRLDPEGVEAIDVAYVVPGLLQSAGVTLVTPEGKLATATRHPSIPTDDDWWGRFPRGGQ
jgi:hypothetical protein